MHTARDDMMFQYEGTSSAAIAAVGEFSQLHEGWAFIPLTAPQWLFASTFPVEQQGTDFADGWTISTASMVHVTSSTQGSTESFTTDRLVGPDLDCSDPLVCTVQELVAAAAASLPAGAHAPAADSGTLLNSGAVLLLGHGSTTMWGTNTAQAATHATSSGCLLSSEGCRHCPNLSTSGQLLQDAMPQQQHAAAASVITTGTPSAVAGLASRRRLGLLVDSQAGLQQLAAAAAVAVAGAAAPVLPQLASTTADEEQQQHCAAKGAVPLDPASPVLGGLRHVCTKPDGSCPHSSSSVPASEDVLVLGVSRPSSPAPADGPPGKEAAVTGACMQDAVTPPAPAGQPVMQLLSCSSLASNTQAGRSNSSLPLSNLSNCSFLRLGSFTTQGSFTAQGSFSSNDSSFTSQRQGSFTGGQPSPAGVLAGVPLGHGPSTMPGQHGLAPASRPSPLPMLHESCSWGSKLDEAPFTADTAQPQQGQQGVQRMRHAGGQSLQQKQQPPQLIYFLD